LVFREGVDKIVLETVVIVVVINDLLIMVDDFMFRKIKRYYYVHL